MRSLVSRYPQLRAICAEGLFRSGNLLAIRPRSSRKKALYIFEALGYHLVYQISSVCCRKIYESNYLNIRADTSLHVLELG